MPNTALIRKFEQTKISNYYETCKNEWNSLVEEVISKLLSRTLTDNQSSDVVVWLLASRNSKGGQ